MADDGDEDHHHQRHGDHRHPPEADPNSARVIQQLAREETERGEAEQGHEAHAEEPAESGAPGEQGAHAVDVARALGRHDLPEVRNSTVLVSP